MGIGLRSRIVLAGLAGLLSLPALALDYRAAARPSVLYDAPSATGKKTFIVTAGTPLEVVVTLEKWVKVRTRDGALAWIERPNLADYQTVVIDADEASIRQAPQPQAAVAFTAKRGVILRVTGPIRDSWIPVRHEDGDTGYARLVDLWGH